jgi:catechol 2,3-dioxygenase-like lactoylglutathione lyase family enzyme
MSQRSDVAPSTIGVELDPDGVFVEYLDGSEVLYRGVPETRAGTVRCQPGKEVHVLVTDPDETEGIMGYVHDRKTHADILESTGVGRVVLEPGEETELFPGVTARADGHAIEIEGDPDAAGGRVFVFEEDELGERSYEIVEGSE